MILLQEIITRLQNILNGTDAQTSSLTRPADYEFVVASQGFHLDYIHDNKNQKNFIPVFASQSGGEYDPVPNLSKAMFNVPIVLYFPVRFKNDFYSLNDFLSQALVGVIGNWGSQSGRCLSTISVAQFGELQEVDLQQFSQWVNENYKREINITQPYMTMSFTLSLMTARQDIAYGNDFTYTMTYRSLETGNNITSDLIWTMCGSQTSISPISQQLIGDNYAKNVCNITNRSFSLTIVPTSDDFWVEFIQQGIYNGQLAVLKPTIVRTFSSFGATISNSFIITNVSENITLGEPYSLTITFGDAL